MPTYTLIPDEHDYEPEEMVANGPQDLLAKVYNYGWNSARVMADGKFIFTVARSVKGVWAILPSLPEDRQTRD